MKKKKNILIVSLMIGLSIVIIVLVYSALNSSKIKRENKNEINNAYKELTNEVKEYNNIRTKYNEKISSFLLSSYNEEHDEYVKLLTEYNEIIKKIDITTEKLNSKCNILYSDIDINKICSNYGLIYEKLINLYITDINIYNNSIKKYNEYNNTNIEPFQMIHNGYIDYNHDNKYEGRELDEKDNNA